MKAKTERVTRLDYCQYLLVSQINYTLTNYADHTEKFSHDMANRYLAGDLHITESFPKEQYHKLMTGKAVRVMVDQNGERIEYTAVKSDDLLAYIRDLEKSLCGGLRNRGPIRFHW